MAKINRFNGNVEAFGKDKLAGEKYLFGSSTTDSDDLTDQYTSEFLRGWGVVGPSDFPPLEWFNALGFTTTQFVSYLHQMGIAEWNATQEYPTEGATVVHAGKVWRRLAVWSLGDEPSVSSSWVDLLDSDSVGDFTYAENKFKGNQNFNAPGSTGDPLPDGTPRTYVVGSEVVSGVEVITSDAEQVTYTSGVLNSGNNTGILRRRYTKDSAGLITKSTQYGGVKLANGSQLQAIVDDIATNGVRIAEDGSDVVVDVDLSVITGGIEFFGLSDVKGLWQRINDDESYKAQTGMRLVNRTPVSTANSYEIDLSGKISYYLSSTLTTSVAGNWVSVNINLPFAIPNGVLSKAVTMDAPNSNQGLEVSLESTLTVATVYFRSDSPTTQELTIKIEAY